VTARASAAVAVIRGALATVDSLPSAERDAAYRLIVAELLEERCRAADQARAAAPDDDVAELAAELAAGARRARTRPTASRARKGGP
jgi:hypothetical protein